MNLLEYAVLFQKLFDEQLTATLTSAWMDDNAGQIIYNGGAEVKIPSIETDGLGDYDRAEGSVRGGISFKYEPMTMSQDRGREFLIDEMDVDETNFDVTVARVVGEFQKTKVTPEIDSYRYSKIASLAEDNGKTSSYTPAEATVLDRLNDDLYAIWDEIGDDTPLVISMSTAVAKLFDNSEKIRRQLSDAEFRKGGVFLKTRAFNDCPILRVPSARMKNQYVFKTGGPGQTEGGIEAAPGAKDVNWIICARSAPIAVAKTDRVKIFSPQETQGAFAWKIEYRKYHDLWIPQNRLAAVRVSLTP